MTSKSRNNRRPVEPKNNELTDDKVEHIFKAYLPNRKPIQANSMEDLRKKWNEETQTVPQDASELFDSLKFPFARKVSEDEMSNSSACDIHEFATEIKLALDLFLGPRNNINIIAISGEDTDGLVFYVGKNPPKEAKTLEARLIEELHASDDEDDEED